MPLECNKHFFFCFFVSFNSLETFLHPRHLCGIILKLSLQYTFYPSILNPKYLQSAPAGTIKFILLKKKKFNFYDFYMSPHTRAHTYTHMHAGEEEINIKGKMK